MSLSEQTFKSWREKEEPEKAEPERLRGKPGECGVPAKRVFGVGLWWCSSEHLKTNEYR